MRYAQMTPVDMAMERGHYLVYVELQEAARAEARTLNIYD